MTTRSMLTVSMMFLLACLDDDGELPEFSEETERAAPYESPQLSGTVTIDTTLYPDAKCNDGSAPVVKIRLDPDGGTNWLVYLEGGGKCESIEECQVRWNDCNPSPEGGVGGKDKMTADPNAMKFNGYGILDFDGYNGEVSPFAGKGFNRIFIPYCSSDVWRGLGHTQEVNYEESCVAGSGDLEVIHFGGAKIVEAVISEIMASALAPGAGDFLVLAGGSAGGGGVQHHIDHVADRVGDAITVLGIADSAFGVGLDQDGIPDEIFSLDAELFWAGLDPATVKRSPGGHIDVLVDSSCWNEEDVETRDYCHFTPYLFPNHIGNPLMQTTNTFDNVHESTYEYYYDLISACNYHTGGVDPELDALYEAYCNPVVDPAEDLETWMRYQIGHDGPEILNSVLHLPYYIVHSSQGLHDHFLKKSEYFYARPLDVLGTWTSSSGQNVDPSVASTVACALGLLGLPGAPACDLHDVRVTSSLPTPVPVIENAFN
jgi:hypothetical protein